METDQLRIQTLQSEDHARWDAFVQQCPDATFFHRAGWQTVIERAFRHQTYFLYVEQHGEVLGVLPLAHIRSRLFGNALVSSPYQVGIGDKRLIFCTIKIYPVKLFLRHLHRPWLKCSHCLVRYSG
ncbi:MAG: hypothetical protein BMS9Abin11_1383 [Gammaproteobacteria bacterium]|nr:MAG: hypothetical protein BMS9Abin11_1383 [Gammaproteobacteria bacterium]